MFVSKKEREEMIRIGDENRRKMLEEQEEQEAIEKEYKAMKRERLKKQKELEVLLLKHIENLITNTSAQSGAIEKAVNMLIQLWRECSL